MHTLRFQKLVQLLLAALVCGSIIFIFLFTLGLNAPFWTVADNDTVAMLQPMYLNAGIDQTYFDHTAYGLFLLLTWWHKIFNFFGLLSALNFSDLKTAADLKAAFQDIVVANRLFSAVLATVFCLSVGTLVRSICKNTWLGLLAAMVCAAVGGVAVQAIQTRSELLSSTAYVLAIISAMRGFASRKGKHCLAWAIACAFFLTFARMVKIMAIINIVLFPAVAWGVYLLSKQRVQTFPEPIFKYRWPTLLVVCLAVYVCFKPLEIIFNLLDDNYALKDFIFSHHFALLLYFFAVMGGLHFFWLKSWTKTLAMLAALLVGFALALRLNDFYSHGRNYQAFIFFKDAGGRYAAGLMHNSVWQIFSTALLERWGSPFTKPQLWVFYSALVSLPFLWQKSRKSAWGVLVLLTCGFAIEVFTGFRYPSSLYKIYSEFLFVTAAFGGWFSVLKTKSHLYTLSAASLLIVVIGVYSTIQHIHANDFSNLNLNNGVSNFCFFLDYCGGPVRDLMSERGGCMKMLGME